MIEAALLKLWLIRRCRQIAVLCGVGLLLPLVSRFSSGWWPPLEWLLDLASHWQWLYFVGLLLTSVVTVGQSRIWAVLLLALPLPWLTPLIPTAEMAPKGAGPALTLASANVYLRNRDVGLLRRWLAEARPDVLVLLEVTSAYAHGLQTPEGYPYQHVAPSEDAFGIAVLSRYPFLSAQTVTRGAEPAYIVARVDWHGQPVEVVAWHPVPPISVQQHQARNKALRELLAAVGSGPAIMAGDMNASPWSNAFAGMGAATFRRATGLLPTWPASGKGWMGIPIDHILVSPHWTIQDQGLGPDLGSDHLPVWARLAVPPAR